MSAAAAVASEEVVARGLSEDEGARGEDGGTDDNFDANSRADDVNDEDKGDGCDELG